MNDSFAVKLSMMGGKNLNISFASQYSIVLLPFVEKTILSLLNCLGTFVEIQLSINVKAFNMLMTL